MDFNTSAIFVMAGTYVINTFREGFLNIFDYFTKMCTSKIMVDNGEWEDILYYRRLSDWLLSLDKEIIKNSKYPRLEWDRDLLKDVHTTKIAVGKYFMYMGGLTWVIVNIYKDTLNSREIDKINCRIVGRNHKQMASEVMSKLTVDDTRPLRLYRPNGGWATLRKKSMDSVFLDNKAEIMRDIDTWVSEEEYYKSHDIPYKQGILLSGEPGTGKTSFAVALANYLNYDMINLPADALYKNPDEFIGKLRKNMIVLIEEVDTMTKKRNAAKKKSNEEEREDSKSVNGEKNTKAGMSSIIEEDLSESSLRNLLQIVDGVESPEHVIFIMTTNHKEVLDPALFRPGRVDVNQELGPISEETALEMMNYFGLDENSKLWNEVKPQLPINPSKLQMMILKDLGKNKLKLVS